MSQLQRYVGNSRSCVTLKMMARGVGGNVDGTQCNLRGTSIQMIRPVSRIIPEDNVCDREIQRVLR